MAQVPPPKSKLDILPRMQAKGPFSVPSPGAQAKDGETLPRRLPQAVPDLITVPGSGKITTTFELVKQSAEKYGNARCLGSRKLVNTHRETKKVKKMVDGEEREVDKQWTYFELSPYEYITFHEYERLTLQLGSGLRKIGLTKADRLHLYAATSQHWLAMSHGAASQSMPVVTAYDTLGEEGLKYSMVATSAKAIFLDPHLLPTLGNVLQEAKDIRYVIWNNQHQIQQTHLEQLKSAHPEIQVMSFEELRKLGEENMVDPVPPATEDLCCIMYTSGSTGTPKGVPLKHKAVVAAGMSFPGAVIRPPLTKESCRCECRCSALHWPRRRPPDLPPARPHPRVRL